MGDRDDVGEGDDVGRAYIFGAPIETLGLSVVG